MARSIESLSDDRYEWFPLEPLRGNPSLWTPALESASADRVVNPSPLPDDPTIVKTAGTPASAVLAIEHASIALSKPSNEPPCSAPQLLLSTAKQLVHYNPARPASNRVSELGDYKTIGHRAPYASLPSSSGRPLAPANLQGSSSFARTSKVGTPIRRNPPKRPAPPVPVLSRSSTLRTFDQNRRTLSACGDPYGFYHPTTFLDRSSYCPSCRSGIVSIN